MSQMKNKKYSENGKAGKKPAHKDMHAVDKHGVNQVGHKPRVGIKPHDRMSGPSEMKSTGGGPTHKGIKGPNEQSMGERFGGDKMKSNHMADGMQGEHYSHLGAAGKKGNLKKGHVSLGTHDLKDLPDYGEFESQGEEGYKGKNERK